ncbi:3-oxoacyl-ACP reductase [Candidatus Poribacteria bacterium]|nr:3-oxoacyl-ACP reductase [Candidatus Poribacteria bacterium]
MGISLNGHVALVTGSSKGLGRQIAMRLGKAGAKVVMNYYNNTSVAEVAFSDFEDVGCKGILVQADVTDGDQIQQMVELAEEKLGSIDIVVANATPRQPQKPIQDYDWDFYQSMIDFFIKSPFLLAQSTLPYMKSKKWGRIINIGSEVFQRSVGNFSAYVAAKGGQVGWTRSMATELAPFGITVNIIAPGWLPVERHQNDPQSTKDAYLATVPMQRWGVPDDVANATLYFASEESAFVTGQTLCVNGGLTPW